MSVQRNARACVQNASPITKSLSFIVAVSFSRIVTPPPVDPIQRERSTPSSLFPWKLAFDHVPLATASLEVVGVLARTGAERKRNHRAAAREVGQAEMSNSSMRVTSL